MFRYVSFSTSFAKFVNSTDSINSKYSWWKLGSIEALFMTRYCVTHKMCSAWIKLRSSSAYKKILTDYLKSLFGLVHCWEHLPLINVVQVWFCPQHHSWVDRVQRKLILQLALRTSCNQHLLARKKFFTSFFQYLLVFFAPRLTCNAIKARLVYADFTSSKRLSVRRNLLGIWNICLTLLLQF